MRLAIYRVLQVFLVLLLTSCQGNSATVSPGAALEGTPSFAELQAALMAELDRLGVDPDKTPATAPTGFSNAVSNLATFVEDPDGVGGNAPVAVVLGWVERVTGDYNQDGVVGISDLTPMGQRWESHVEYIIPGELPSGEAGDDGGTGIGNPATAGSGADNWRLARIDGNGDGIINISDITAIGQHWQERTVGYRVYRIRPGETQFTMLLNADDPSLPYTVPRGSTFPPGESSPDPHRPVIYQFTDDQLGAAQGVYEYYIAPYDDSDDSEGQASLMAGANLDGGGGGSMPPVGVLTASPTMGEHPLEVTWDMSDSYDIDGHLTKYEWDMDQDNTTWEIETYPNPVQTIIYNTPGTKTQWVRVTDNDGHTSMAFSKVLVAAPGGNYPPLAQVNGSPPEGPMPLDVTWDASASSDIDGSIAKYEWDMDGDPSTFEFDGGATSSYLMTYNTGGEKLQWVRVTDDQGATDAAFAVVHVFGGGSTAPTALLGANPASGTAPLTVSFSAAASFDPDGNIVKYEFDWEGDGSWDHDNGAVSDVLHLYGMAGTYAPTVRVTDNDGLTDEMSIPVQVYP